MQARLEGDPEYYDAKVAGWWVWGISSWIGSGWCSGDGPWTSVDGKLAKDAGRGVNRQLPHLGNGMGVHRGDEVWPHIEALAQRLRRVRVCCGDWARVTSPSVTWRHGLTAVFLDPPYGATRTSDLYATDCTEVHHRVRAWCEANGDNPQLRIVLCGYEGEHDTLTELGWDEVAWKAKGGYGSQGDGDGRENAARERIWYSPHCLSAAQMSLFSGEA